MRGIIQTSTINRRARTLELKRSIKTFASHIGISTIQVLQSIELAPRNQIEKEPRVSEAPSLLLEAAETDYELSGEKDLQLHIGRKPH